MAIAWKARVAEEGGANRDVSVFVAPGLGRTFQLTGTLRLNPEEAADLKARMARPAPLAPEEFGTVWQALVGISDADDRRAAARIMERFKPKEVQG